MRHALHDMSVHPVAATLALNCIVAQDCLAPRGAPERHKCVRCGSERMR